MLQSSPQLTYLTEVLGIKSFIGDREASVSGMGGQVMAQSSDNPSIASTNINFHPKELVFVIDAKPTKEELSLLQKMMSAMKPMEVEKVEASEHMEVAQGQRALIFGSEVFKNWTNQSETFSGEKVINGVVCQLAPDLQSMLSDNELAKVNKKKLWVQMKAIQKEMQN